MRALRGAHAFRALGDAGSACLWLSVTEADHDAAWLSRMLTAQLARLLGLSRWTVSRALNGHAGVDPRTAERIKEAARREGFSPSLLGSGLRSGRTNLVGICLPDLVDLLSQRIHDEIPGYDDPEHFREDDFDAHPLTYLREQILAAIEKRRG